jgi:hypothetical protein
LEAILKRGIDLGGEGEAIMRDDLAAPESTKKVISFSLGPTFKFIKGSP